MNPPDPRKRKSSFATNTEGEPPQKKNPSVNDLTATCTPSKGVSKYCNECKKGYSNEKSHAAICTRKAVACAYPALQPGGHAETVVLHREGGFFRCIRCQKQLKKDQNMKEHARKCYSSLGPSNDVKQGRHNLVHPACPSTTSNADGPVYALPVVPEDTPRHLNTPRADQSVNHVLGESNNPHSEDLETAHEDSSLPPLWSRPNEYEALIRPGEHTISDDVLLICTPFVINTEYMALICISCKYAVSPDGSLKHIRRIHPQCKIPQNFVADLNGKYPKLVSEKIHPGSVAEAVFGLAVPVKEYIVCSRCRHGYVSIGSWRSHLCEMTDTDLHGQQPWFPSLVQTFFLGSKLCYFPIRTPLSETGDIVTNDYALFTSQYPDINTCEGEVAEPEDYRELNQFLSKEGWVAHISGCKKSELTTLTSLPKPAEPLAAISPHVLALMSNIQVAIGNAGFHVRRLLGRRPSDNHDGIRTVHHRDVQPQSMKRYGLTVTCLVCFMMRCYQGWECTYVMKLTDAQEKACRALGEALNLPPSCGSQVEGEEERELPNQMNDWHDYSEIEEVSEDSDDEVYDDGETLPDEQVSLHCRSDGIKPNPIVENPIQSCILDILTSLYTHLPAGNDNKFFSPILRFIVLFSFKVTGQWLPPRQITHIFSALLFCGREVMMALMLGHMDKETETRYSEAYSAIVSFIDDEREGPIPAMYILMRPLNRFSSAEEGTLRFTALDFNGDNIIVAGHVLYLRDIRYFVETLIDEVKFHFKSKLFFNLDVADTNWTPGVVHEEPRNTSPQYSCFRDARNVFPRHKNDLLDKILTHPRLRGHFHYLDQNGQIAWKASSCFAYMDACHDAEMMLFCAAQTSVGEPGRGTEIASHLVSNVSGGTIRNVLVMFQYFCMMGTFNKTSHITERDMFMMRVPHPEVGRLWTLYLTFVRPLVVVWKTYFHGPKAASRARDRLFFGPHRPVTSSELSRSLSYHTHRLLNIKISISLWRHIATWFLNHHLACFHNHLALPNRSALATQLGHSEATHGLYAADSRLPSAIDFHIFFQTMRTSGIWHNLVGFKSTLLQDMDMGHCNNMNIDILKQTQEETHLYGEHMYSFQPTASGIAEEVKKILIPEIVRLNVQTRANDLASLLDTMGIDLQSPLSRPLMPPASHILHPSRLRDLRRFLGDDNATFKHTQQASALELIASKDASLLIVGPTGSGKTLPLFMSIAYYDQGNSTILILPLVAMHDEYRSRARKYGLSFRTWGMGGLPSATPQILLVAVENCVWDELKVHITTLIRLGRLARIVVDEAHLLLKHASFRPCVDMLQHFGCMPAPILLMTATCPRNLEKELFGKLGRQVYQVLRRSTDRPELSQRMEPVYSKDIEEAVAGKIKLLQEELRGPDRALLFCWSHDECDRMAGLLGWKPYHASVPLEERSESMRTWVSGEVLGLVCTSMLNCCLDYPSVRYVFHLGPPRDVMDYYQAIGRAARGSGCGRSIVYFDPARLTKFTGDNRFGASLIYEMLRDNSMCRRLRPAIFLDGTATSCAMLPGAQLCDVCDADLSTVPPDTGPLTFPLHLISPSNSVTAALEPTNAPEPKPSVQKSMACAQATANPMSQPAPSATFGNHFVAAQASLKQSLKSWSDRRGHQIRTACQALAKSCINCWAQGFEYHSHCLSDCPHSRVDRDEWKSWHKHPKLPVGTCFYCGCPLKMSYLSPTGQELPVHNHPCDQTCHWTTTLKPLAFATFHNAQLIQVVSQSSLRNGRQFDALDFPGYAKWLCETGEDDSLNLVNILLLFCTLRGLPTSPTVATSLSES